MKSSNGTLKLKKKKIIDKKKFEEARSNCINGPALTGRSTRAVNNVEIPPHRPPKKKEERENPAPC
jgi:hypothetical protein